MAKSNTLLKRTANALLAYIATASADAPLPSEHRLARSLDVSRTTVHGALLYLEQQRVIVRNGKQVTAARQPKEHDHFALTQTVGPRERIEEILMERMLRGGWAPGHEFSESDLARDSQTSTASVREFLIGFERFQMVKKRPRGGWQLLGLDVDFVNEVADMRDLIELAAMRRIPTSPEKDWLAKLNVLLTEHEELQDEIDTRYLDFPALDREFHSLLISQLKNRFAIKHLDVVTFVFHYHYKWGRETQRKRVACSVAQHIGILNALLQSDAPLARQRLGAHLVTSRDSLIESLKPAG
jgi:DNA-binding GntR family transcriptional regulator